MTFVKTCKLSISLLAVLCCAFPACADFQAAWDNPNANMAAGSTKPGYANLAWSTGTVLPIKTRAGMAASTQNQVNKQCTSALLLAIMETIQI